MNRYNFEDVRGIRKATKKQVAQADYVDLAVMLAGLPIGGSITITREEIELWKVSRVTNPSDYWYCTGPLQAAHTVNISVYESIKE